MPVIHIEFQHFRMLACEENSKAVTEANRARELSDINTIDATSTAEKVCRSIASDVTLMGHEIENVLLKLKAITAENLTDERDAAVTMLRAELKRLDNVKKQLNVSLQYGFEISKKVSGNNHGIDEDTLKKIRKAQKEAKEDNKSPSRKRPFQSDAKRQFPCHSCGGYGHWKGDLACPAAFRTPGVQPYSHLSFQPGFQPPPPSVRQQLPPPPPLGRPPAQHLPSYPNFYQKNW